MYDYIVQIIKASWYVLAEMSPYLLLGFLLAGILSICISADWVKKHLGGRGAWPVIKASLFGIPLPLCSCGVLPVSASIKRHGASKAATTSFLLSTPQTGVDSIAVTYAMMGPVFAIFRPIAALITGLLGGWLVEFFADPKISPAKVTDKNVDALQSSHLTKDKCQAECCTSKASGFMRVMQGLKHGFLVLPGDIGWPLLLGVVIAGVIAVAVPEKHLAAYLGGGVVSILIMMVVGIPIYVCATASVPIAAGFMFMGASPGAALAFLIAGPVTNAATIVTVLRVLGRKVVVIYLLTVAIGAVGCGLLLDWIFQLFGIEVPALTASQHEHFTSSWFATLSAVLLLCLLAYSSLNGIVSKFAKKGKNIEHGRQNDSDQVQKEMKQLNFSVKGMTCQHCVSSVKNAVSSIDGVKSVDVELSGKTTVIANKDIQAEQIVNAIDEVGYEAKMLE